MVKIAHFTQCWLPFYRQILQHYTFIDINNHPPLSGKRAGVGGGGEDGPNKRGAAAEANSAGTEASNSWEEQLGLGHPGGGRGR